jgi:hypothetical protein
MVSKTPSQKTFLGRLFTKPKKPVGQRAEAIRQRIRGKIKVNEVFVENVKRYIEMNKVSMGSSERAVEEKDIDLIKKRISTLKNRLRKVNATEKTAKK